MSGAHNFFRLYAPVICDHPQLRRMSRTLTLCLQFPTACNHHTVEAASWQKHDSFSSQSVFILHSNVCLGLSNPYIFSALWRQHKYKITAHHIPILLRGLVEAVITNDWCIIYSLWCTAWTFNSQPPQKHIDPKHKLWHPLILFNLFPSTFPLHH